MVSMNYLTNSTYGMGKYSCFLPFPLNRESFYYFPFLATTLSNTHNHSLNFFRLTSKVMRNKLFNILKII